MVFKPSPSARSLARTLKDQGYSTGAFVGAYVLNRRFGLADGFDTYDDQVRRRDDGTATLESERRGDAVADAAIAWLSSAREPFCAWVHLYDPHAPYNPPKEHREHAAGDAYNGEIAFADAQVARLVAAVRSKSPDSTTIIVAGDHGEGLGEHGEQTHGMLAYDSTLRVPLVIAGAGVDRQTIAAPASLSDVTPSILGRLRMSALATAGAGADLFAAVSADRDVYAETMYPRAAGWRTLTALAGDQWKLVLSSDPELYDIRADPGELRNVASDQPRIVEGMTARIQQIAAAARTVAPSQDEVAPEAAERLRALGYVSGSTRSRADTSGPNPARVIAAWTTFEAALTLVNQGRSRQALPALRELAERFPDSSLFQGTYARALKDTGQAPAAVKIYKAAIARNPADSSLFHDLAIAARTAGDTAEAVRAERAALAVNAEDPAALNGLGLLHVESGRPADAANAFERAAAADPANASYWANLGNARREMGNSKAAEEAYRRALDVDGTHADAANGLGVLLVQQRRASEAIAWFARAIQRAPEFHEARLNLGIAYQESGNGAKAAELYREILKKTPPQFARERAAAAELLKSIR
jgi:tetratricopeptide (TPR) repeat protein